MAFGVDRVERITVAIEIEIGVVAGGRGDLPRGGGECRRPGRILLGGPGKGRTATGDAMTVNRRNFVRTSVLAGVAGAITTAPAAAQPAA